jgi:hypothetical protein
VRPAQQPGSETALAGATQKQFGVYLRTDWVTQTENIERKGLDTMAISRLDKRACKDIEPFRRFQYSNTFFKPDLDILTGIGFGAISHTKYRSSRKRLRVEGETGIDTRDISYAI